MYTHICMYVYVYTYTRVICVYIHIYIYIYIYVCLYSYTYVYTSSFILRAALTKHQISGSISLLLHTIPHYGIVLYDIYV